MLKQMTRRKSLFPYSWGTPVRLGCFVRILKNETCDYRITMLKILGGTMLYKFKLSLA